MRMRGICPKCGTVGTRHVYGRKDKNGETLYYLSFVHREKMGKKGGRVLTHYICAVEILDF